MNNVFEYWQDLMVRDATPHYLRDEEEPYSLPIVLKVPKNVSEKPTHEEAILVVAGCFVKLFTSPDVPGNPAWEEPVKSWMKGRIRKIVRRAKTPEWEKLISNLNPDGSVLNINHTVDGRTVECVVLPPHPSFEHPAAIEKLQVSGLDLERDTAGMTRTVTSGTTMKLALNPGFQMSTGKVLAQVGHAVQLMIRDAQLDDLHQWEKNNLNISLVHWDDLVKPIVEVQDAGFTEVPPGTFTVKAGF